jgi:hypothetical protein
MNDISFNTEPAATADRQFEEPSPIGECWKKRVMRGVKSAVAAGSGLNKDGLGKR